MFYTPQPINLLPKGCYKDNCVNDQVFECLIVGQPRMCQESDRQVLTFATYTQCWVLTLHQYFMFIFPHRTKGHRAFWRAELQEERTRLKPWEVPIKEPTGLQPKLQQISLFLPRQGSKHKRNRFWGGIPPNSIKSFLSFLHHPLHIWQGQSTAPGAEGIAEPGL